MAWWALWVSRQRSGPVGRTVTSHHQGWRTESHRRAVCAVHLLWGLCSPLTQVQKHALRLIGIYELPRMCDCALLMEPHPVRSVLLQLGRPGVSPRRHGSRAGVCKAYSLEWHSFPLWADCHRDCSVRLPQIKHYYLFLLLLIFPLLKSNNISFPYVSGTGQSWPSALTVSLLFHVTHRMFHLTTQLYRVSGGYSRAPFWLIPQFMNLSWS